MRRDTARPALSGYPRPLYRARAFRPYRRAGDRTRSKSPIRGAGHWPRRVLCRPRSLDRCWPPRSRDWRRAAGECSCGLPLICGFVLDDPKFRIFNLVHRGPQPLCKIRAAPSSAGSRYCGDTQHSRSSAAGARYSVLLIAKAWSWTASIVSPAVFRRFFISSAVSSIFRCIHVPTSRWFISKKGSHPAVAFRGCRRSTCAAPSRRSAVGWRDQLSRQIAIADYFLGQVDHIAT